MYLLMYHPKQLIQCLNQLLISIFRFQLTIHILHIQDGLDNIKLDTAF